MSFSSYSSSSAAAAVAAEKNNVQQNNSRKSATIIPAIGFSSSSSKACFSSHNNNSHHHHHHLGTTTATAECISSSSRDNNSRHAIHVLFLQPLPNDPHEHFLNRLTSFIGEKVHKKGFHHTEIVVPDLQSSSDGGFLSSSIYNGECVTLTKTKTFANPGYTVMTFNVTGSELKGIMNYLHESRRMQLSFDGLGMYLASLPVQIGFRRSGSTFCSKHVTMALKSGGIDAVMDLNENIVTPSKLYKVLHEKIPSDRKVAGTVPFKQQSMLHNGRIMPIFSISE